MAEIPSLGERGGGWVVLQFALMFAIVVAGLVAPGWPEGLAGVLAAVGAVLAVAGGIVVVLAARALGASLTPFPRPRSGGSLADTGPYRFVRHPTYTGGILFFSGFSLALSPWALVLTALLSLVWGMKAAVEERFLAAHYVDYEAYCGRTRFRLVPYVY